MSVPEPLELELLGVPVRLEADDAEVHARLALCYGRSRAEPSAFDATKPARILVARVARSGRGYRVTAGARAERLEQDAIEAVRALNHELLQAVMQRSRAHYFVHAAVVVWRGQALVLPGLSRAGKSTLALALLLEGARYLSDELLCFTHAGLAEPLPRALKIRDECVAWFPELAARFVGDGEGRFLPFEALPDDVLAAPAPVGAVVVPHWSPGAPDRPAPISPGAAVLALAASSLNFGAHRELSLDWLAALAGDGTAFELAWNDPRAAARALVAELAG
jgi:hypothetical protein